MRIAVCDDSNIVAAFMEEYISSFLVCLPINLLDTFFILRYHRHIYGKPVWGKRSFALRVTIVLLLFTMVLALVPAMLLWGMVLFSAFWVSAFSVEQNKKILFQLVLLSLSVLSLVFAFTVAVALSTDEKSIGIGTVLCSHVLFGIMVEAAIRLNKSLSAKLPFSMWFILFSIPATSLVCIPLFTKYFDLNENVAQSVGRLQIPFLLAIFFINIMVFYLFNKFSELLNTSVDAALLQQQVSMQEKYYQTMEQNHRKIRVLQHDMRNQINTIAALFEDGQTDALGRYLQEIKETVYCVDKLIVTGNTAIDTVLNIKISELKANAVQVAINIILPQTVKLSFKQSAILFGNLLDNVLDECKRLSAEKRKATIQLSYTDKILFIKIKNTMAVSEKAFPLLTDKKDSSSHGIGLKSIQQVVDQFNGTLKLSAKDSVFQSTIVLYGV